LGLLLRPRLGTLKELRCDLTSTGGHMLAAQNEVFVTGYHHPRYCYNPIWMG